MTISNITVTLTLAIGLASFAPRFVGGPSTSLRAGPQAQSPRATAVAIDADDIGGVVTGPSGPEAGVWVIAETRDLPRPLHQDRRHRRSGTLRRSRPAEARLLASGCAATGWSTAPRSTSEPGRLRQHHGHARADAGRAAQYYPAIYWYSMLRIPTAGRVRRTGEFAANVTQQRWLGSMKNLGCVGCHQLGQLSTRTMPDRARHVRLGR